MQPSSLIDGGSSRVVPRVVEVTPVRGLGGRRFQPTAERDVDPFLRAAAERLVQPVGSVVMALPECRLPVGVADMVVAALDPVLLRERLEAGIRPILSETEARIVSGCKSERPTSLHALIKISGTSEGQTKRVVSGLVQAGALTRRGDRWFRHDGLRPLGRIHALEAKVADWRAGIDQCLRYGAYADSSAIVVPRLSERVEANVRLACAPLGVGAYIGDRWLTRSRLSRLHASRRFLASEFVLAALGDSVAVSPAGESRCDVGSALG